MIFLKSLTDSLLLRFVLFVAIFLIFPTGCGVLGEEEPFHPPTDEGPWILVDLWHTRLQNPEDYRLEKGNYNYQGVFGYARLFDHLKNNGYNWQSIRTMPISAPRLEGFDAIFINLLHEDRPDFTADEIQVITRFVERGGGLFVIVDHTNVYRHAERVNPLLEPMGISVLYSTAVDYPPEYSVSGLGWLMSWDFTDHPVTEGVEMISIQTGGALETDHGVAFTSDKSFADYWDESDSHGFYGNWRHDGDPELEPFGPLAIVAAAQYGEGRVAVVADQNIFGDAWLHFGHNFELALNIFQWTTGRHEQSEKLRNIKPSGLNLAVDAFHNNFRTGRTELDGYYNFFVHFNRDHEVTGRATMDINEHHDVLIFLNPDTHFETSTLASIEAHLQAGKRVVVTFEANDVSAELAQLLHELAPDFSYEYDNQHITFDDRENLSSRQLSESVIPSKLPLTSEKLSLNGINLSSHQVRFQQGERISTPYLLDVQSTWGEPLIQAQHDDKRIDIARSKLVNDGELIIFVQDGFWRSSTMGERESEVPADFSRPAIELQYRFLDYLKQPLQ